MFKLAIASLALGVNSTFADQDKWSYFEVPHIRSGEYRPEASLISKNVLPLPAQNKQYNLGYLTVRKNSDGSEEVSLSVEQGRQLICTPGECTISISFDGRPPVKFQGYFAKDWGATMIVLQNPNVFTAGARQAKNITVHFREASNGQATYNFETAFPLKFPAQLKRLNG